MHHLGIGMPEGVAAVANVKSAIAAAQSAYENLAAIPSNSSCCCE